MLEKDKPCRSVIHTGTEKSHFEDETLETIWEMAEHGDVLFDNLVEEMHNKEGILEMESDGLILIRDGKVELLDEGYCRARSITRRHLLAERLFADVLDLSDYEDDACRFEHVISEEVEEAICTFLGHPPTCPHGRAIPRGECCKVFTRKVKPLVQSLTDIEVGSTVKIVFITSSAMNRLTSIGLVPGAEVKLLQKRPSFVLGIDETNIAVDEDIAKGIYVKP